MDSNQRKKDQNKFKQIMNYFYRLLKSLLKYTGISEPEI